MKTLLVVSLIWITAFGCASKETKKGAESSKGRSFEVRYVTRTIKIPDDARKLRLWIPLPQDNMHQHITDLGVKSPFKYSITTEKKYGNKMIFMSVPDPPSQFDVEVSFNVERFENTVQYGRAQNADLTKLALLPSTLVPLSGEISSLGMKIVEGRRTQMDKVRALYEHTLDHMQYDKTGSGWGRGDFTYACDVGRGNCSDYHSYFIGLCRNIGIPAYFEIGLSIPPEPDDGKIGSYHCWAYFWGGGQWIPVDISEADKNQDMKEYFFGNLNENRVAFSVGRDIILEPPQNGQSLNFFVYPYAEVDGETYENVSSEFYYRNLSPPDD